MAASLGVSRIAHREVHLWRIAISTGRIGVEADVRSVLAGYVGCSPETIRIRREGGRPELATGSCPGLSFNLSHSHCLALLAVARNARVGVDLEWVRRGIRVEALARRFFSAAEADRLCALPPTAREAAFFRTWVRKEAYVKALGAGVPAGLARFTVPIAEYGSPRILSTELEDDDSAFSLHDLDLPPGYVGALAVEIVRDAGLQFRTFDANATGWD